MHYEDQGRQFSLLAGLSVGALLGIGLALLLGGRVRRGSAPRLIPGWR